MKVYFKTEKGVLYQGDALEVLKKLPDESVDTIITSPPYYGKRVYPGTERVWGGDPDCDHEWVEAGRPPVKLFDWGHSDPKYKKANVNRLKTAGMFCKKCGAWYGQLGLEPTPELYVDHLIEIFREAKRVLKPSGSLFVNIDDTWVTAGYRYRPTTVEAMKEPEERDVFPVKKSLILVPEMFAVKMVYEEGWILREKMVWSKKVWLYKDGTTVGNAMPQSVRDRLSHVWEYIFHFTKSQRYYFSIDSMRLPLKKSTIERAHRGVKSWKLNGTTKGLTVKNKIRWQEKIKTAVKREAIRLYLDRKLEEKRLSVEDLARITGMSVSELSRYFKAEPGKSSIPSKSVWDALKPILGLDEYEKCMKGGCWLEEDINIPGVKPCDVVQLSVKPSRYAHLATFPEEIPEMLIKLSTPKNGVVLDPFAEAGTTLVVAERLNREWIGIEMSPEYCEIVKRRFEKELSPNT